MARAAVQMLYSIAEKIVHARPADGDKFRKLKASNAGLQRKARWTKLRQYLRLWAHDTLVQHGSKAGSMLLNLPSRRRKKSAGRSGGAPGDARTAHGRSSASASSASSSSVVGAPGVVRDGAVGKGGQGTGLPVSP